MANMSYCKFNNTLEDLNACIEALEDRNISSESEKRKAKMLMKNFLEFCASEGIIESFNYEVIEEIISECEDQDE